MGAGIANLLTIAQACDPSIAKEKVTGMRYGEFKKLVAEAVIARLEPIQRRYREIVAERGYIESVLQQGREQVLPLAENTVQKAKRAMGCTV
ncbi:MAG: hypothetical protein ACRD4G_03775 [Bryobacteraceae bacterium]